MQHNPSKEHSQIRGYGGFTIVELLIVVVVIGILAAITIVAYNGLQARAAGAALESDLHSSAIQLALDQTASGSYPTTEGAANSGQGLQTSLGTIYQYTSDGSTYCLSATSQKAGATAFHISSTNGTTESGVCAGHTAPGGGEPAGNQGIVTTLAGSNSPGFADGAGSGAQFDYPADIAVDTSGTLYVADENNNRIRKITSAGVVTTLAGSTRGFANGTGTSAQFYRPSGITVDSAGTVYVADTYNHRIRKITSSGVVSTLAGNGTAGYIDGTGGSAEFYWPSGITVDASGTVYVADTYNNCIRKITSSGVVSTLAGNGTYGYIDGTGGSAEFGRPSGITLDASGIMYVTDTFGGRIRKVTLAGVVSTLAGNGTAGYIDGTGSSAEFNYPVGITVDTAGTIYVADQTNSRIRMITPSGVVSTLAGNSTAGSADGTGTSAQFNHPAGVVVNTDGTIYVADSANYRIRVIK